MLDAQDHGATPIVTFHVIGTDDPPEIGCGIADQMLLVDQPSSLAKGGLLRLTGGLVSAEPSQTGDRAITATTFFSPKGSVAISKYSVRLRNYNR